MLYEIVVLVLICAVAGLGLYVSKLRTNVWILRTEVKVLAREVSDAFWKKVVEKDYEEHDKASQEEKINP